MCGYVCVRMTLCIFNVAECHFIFFVFFTAAHPSIILAAGLKKKKTLVGAYCTAVKSIHNNICFENPGFDSLSPKMSL